MDKKQATSLEWQGACESCPDDKAECLEKNEDPLAENGDPLWAPQLGQGQGGVYGKHGVTHWGRVRHVCVGKLTIIGSDNGLSPGRRQAIIWTNAGILLIGPFSEISIGIQTFSFRKMHFKISSAKWRPFCLSFNVVKDMSCRRQWRVNQGQKKVLKHVWPGIGVCCLIVGK